VTQHRLSSLRPFSVGVHKSIARSSECVHGYVNNHLQRYHPLCGVATQDTDPPTLSDADSSQCGTDLVHDTASFLVRDVTELLCLALDNLARASARPVRV